MTDIQANTNLSDNQDHDSPWKEALELYLEQAMALLFADVYQAIDWAQPVTFLDKELQKILAKAERTRTYADKLVKVKLTNGEEKWLLIHIEVQGEPEEGFAQRMFDYNSRIRQRYKKDVMSLAILTDSRKNYCPDEYLFELLGACRTNQSIKC
jgi:integrase